MTIAVIILSVLLVLSVTALIIQNRKIKKDPFNSPSKRAGIIRQRWEQKNSYNSPGYMTYTMGHNDVVIEVEAIKFNSGLSRIKVVKVMGNHDDEQKNFYLKKLPEIIETSQITFLDDVEMENKPFNV